MKLYQLHRTTLVHTSIKSAWDFFSDPRNLAAITPPDMSFEIVDEANLPLKAHSGMLISYTVKPLLGIKMRWLTEIKAVSKEHYFIDEQRSGPYAFWYHEHYFEPGAHELETKMTDKVSYALPYGILGRVANQMLVSAKLKDIFDYRETAISRIFPNVFL